MSTREEVLAGERFAFGDNWRKFLDGLSDARVAEAERSLCDLLRVRTLAGRSFLDVGSGSGLFSLAARRLGARVVSFDYDPQSVDCTRALRERYFPDDPAWHVEPGSVLDAEYLDRLGTFDVVYSWGVLHHTGDMWQSLENTASRVRPGGTLAVAIYNDQGRASRRWSTVKKAYNRLPSALRFLVLAPAFVRLWGPTMLRDLLRGKPFHSWREYRHQRGMSPWRDVVDWVGGYPFEVAKPDELIDFFGARGFQLTKLISVGGGHGCNELVFRSVARHAAAEC